jgi:hypothetical protein
MFYEEGYMPLAQAASEVMGRLQALQAKGAVCDLSQGLGPHLAVTLWDICETAGKITVTSPNGTMIDASKTLVAWADPLAFSNEHVDLRIGSVGSSTLPGADGAPRSREDLVFEYGGFLSLPICIPESSFQSSLTLLEDYVAQPLADAEIEAAAQSILSFVDTKPFVTRALAREWLGMSISRRKLKLAWGIAARHHLPLAEPGRWRGL